MAVHVEIVGALLHMKVYVMEGVVGCAWKCNSAGTGGSKKGSGEAGINSFSLVTSGRT